MSITINGYKPFLIQKMGSEANPVYDSNVQWGMLVKSFPFQALPEAKEPYKNDWKDENGDEEYVGELKFKAYTMSVEFAMVEDSTSTEAGNEIIGRKLKAFIDYIKDGQFKIYDTYTGIGRQKVRYAGYDDKGYMMMGDHARAIFIIKFKVNDPITNISKPVAIPAIGILHTNGTTYTKEEWTEGGYPSSAAVGVSIISSGHRIILHKSQGEGLKWATTGTDHILLSDVFTTESLSVAEGDLSGKLNTDAIMSAVSRGEMSGAPAAQWCRALGDGWSMMAGGEHKIIKAKMTEINACLVLIGGTEISDDDNMWVSTQMDKDTAWGYSGDNVKKLIGYNKQEGAGFPPYTPPMKVRAIKDMSETLSMRVIGPSSIPTMNTDYQYSVSFNRTPSAITYMKVACQDSDITISDVTNNGFKLRFNHTYNAKVKNVKVFIYCEADGQWFSEIRTISIARVIGIGIQHKNGKVYSAAEWTAGGFYNEEARGVAVTDGTHDVCLHKSQSDGITWSYSEGLVTDCYATTNVDDAKNDFAGKTNTDAIIAAKSTISGFECPAADWCRAFGSEWYLPGCGEMLMIVSNRATIDGYLTLIGGTVLQEELWSSTQYDSRHSWVILDDGVIVGPRAQWDFTRAVAAL